MVIGVILPSTLLHSVFRRRIRDFSAFSAAASSFADFFCRSLSFWAARRIFLDERAFLCFFAGFLLVLLFVLIFFFFFLRPSVDELLLEELDDDAFDDALSASLSSSSALPHRHRRRP
jgi:fatty acid desaturase